MRKPVMLMILDGYGISENQTGNAISAAKKPNLDRILKKYPNTTLEACGMSVGLPEGQMGNSEVGHLNIGAGRIIYQSFTRISKSIVDGDFFNNAALNKAVDNAIKNNSDLHLLGLVSPGGVHSHTGHIKALLKLCEMKGLRRVYLHGFLDGRDVPPASAEEYIMDIEKAMIEMGTGTIATVSGRYYAMDRDNRWDRVKSAYDALVYGKGNTADSALKAIERSYKDNLTDEFVVPAVITKDGEPAAVIKNKDSVIFFNFRPDRARELARAINDREFHGFEREPLDLTFVTMTEYDSTMENVLVAFPNETYKNTLGEYLSKSGKTQLRIAETEKYAHVTFFFNGGVEAPNEKEDRVLIPSPKIATYDLQPEMSAYSVRDEVLKRIDSGYYDFIVLNFANADMVGHTGILEAAKKAVEAVDECLGSIVDKILQRDGTVFITADHGNAESMVDLSTGKAMTAHTTDPVPFIYVSNNARPLRQNGILADIAPTLLDVMELEIPVEMTGKSLIIK